MSNLLSLSWQRCPSPAPFVWSGALILGDVDSPGATLTLDAPLPPYSRCRSPLFVACCTDGTRSTWLSGAPRLAVWLARSGLPLPTAADVDWLSGYNSPSLHGGTARPLVAP